MRTPQQLVELFRSTGHKITPQRQRIFELLHEDPTHPTAEAVHARLVADMPSVSLRTVYATLHELVDLGEIHNLTLGTGSTRFDPNVAAHHHLVCRSCGRVEDLSVEYPGVALPADNPFGFQADTTEIVFRGRCADCADRKPAPDSSPTP